PSAVPQMPMQAAYPPQPPVEQIPPMPVTLEAAFPVTLEATIPVPPMPAPPMPATLEAALPPPPMPVAPQVAPPVPPMPPESVPPVPPEALQAVPMPAAPAQPAAPEQAVDAPSQEPSVLEQLIHEQQTIEQPLLEQTALEQLILDQPPREHPAPEPPPLDDSVLEQTILRELLLDQIPAEPSLVQQYPAEHPTIAYQVEPSALEQRQLEPAPPITPLAPFPIPSMPMAAATVGSTTWQQFSMEPTRIEQPLVQSNPWQSVPWQPVPLEKESWQPAPLEQRLLHQYEPEPIDSFRQPKQQKSADWGSAGLPPASHEFDHPATEHPGVYPTRHPMGAQSPSTRKPKGVPLALKLGVAVLAFVLVAGGAGLALFLASTAEAKADYYQLGDDRIPSVKFVLGEDRTMAGITSSEDGIVTKILTYNEPLVDQAQDMLKYAGYLVNNDGFDAVSDIDFFWATGFGMLERYSVEPGKTITVSIDYDELGYTITVVKKAGDLQGNDSSYSGEPTITPAPGWIEDETSSDSVYEKGHTRFAFHAIRDFDYPGSIEEYAESCHPSRFLDDDLTYISELTPIQIGGFDAWKYEFTTALNWGLMIIIDDSPSVYEIAVFAAMTEYDEQLAAEIQSMLDSFRVE
ncbi:MAG: hypothetical protein FWD55_05625, partial [Propionibacteriaceae bacterium]|nr:hypothetical protein [Propionibacteriaceae bacterium]